MLKVWPPLAGSTPSQVWARARWPEEDREELGDALEGAEGEGQQRAHAGVAHGSSAGASLAAELSSGTAAYA